jgi:hypothetical protein
MHDKIAEQGFERSVIKVDKTLTNSCGHEQEKEVINILIDSGLYLDMELVERFRLLHFIVASYFKDASR